MLKECTQHGYFRAEVCPVCGQPSRFLMNDRELDHLGRILTGVLRHFPDRYGLQVDAHGWIDLNEIARAIAQRHPAYRWLRPHHLVAIAETDAKGRYEVRGEKVRATYGHTLEVDLDLPTEGIPDHLYYPVTREEATIVLEVGLRPSDRRKVHLSKTAADAAAAGRVRTPEPIILEVDTQKAREQGIVIMQAGKTVYLADRVPAELLRQVETPPSPEADAPAGPSEA